MAAAPRLTILIPVYNEFDYTVECLLSIREALPETPFEVLIADDCSTAAEARLLETVPNLIYLRQPENVGFIRNCNLAFAACRGDYVLLLNNDTQVLPGAIDAWSPRSMPTRTLAAVGPKIIYPNGRLQEAGCFVRPNGESGMVGLFGNPDEAGYCYDRDVTYCSGAALMVRRAHVGDTLFDEPFQPAYCEDADLCLRLLAAGHRVRYLHEAVVVHHLSVSIEPPVAASGGCASSRATSSAWSSAGGADRAHGPRARARVLPAAIPPDARERPVVGRRLHRMDQRGEGAAELHRPLPAASAGRSRLLRSAHRGRACAGRRSSPARYGIEGFCVYYYNFGGRADAVGAAGDGARQSRDSVPLVPVLGQRELDPPLGRRRRAKSCWSRATTPRRSTRIIADAVAPGRRPALPAGERPAAVPGLPPAAVAGRARASPPRCRAAFARAGFPGRASRLCREHGSGRPAACGRPISASTPASSFRRTAAPSPARDAVEIVKDDWTGYRYDYADTVVAFVARESVPYPRYPAVFPCWDNTPRQRLRGTSFDGATPEAFRCYVEEKIEELRQFHMGDERLLFVNAWNEWAEGTHLEPDSGFGHRWLEALRDAVAAKRCA